jgi:outer membrane protein assembly factor BamE (lipoprotein component of BamABCDE complex)
MTLPHGNRALLAVAMGGAVLAAGCTPLRTHQGYFLDPTLSQAIQPGVENRDSVRGTLGRPTFTGQFDQRDWYYVSRRTHQYAFRMPRPTDTTVLHVRFDEQGNVQRVDRTGMELVQNIRPDRDTTPVVGSKTNLFQDLFGNIGAVGAVGQGGQTPDNPQ